MIHDSETTELLRNSARGALSGLPESLQLARGDDLPVDAVPRFLALAIEQGWLGVCAPDKLGGLALGMTSAVPIASEIGRALAPGPFMANAVVLPTLAGFASARGALDELVSGAVAGRRSAALGTVDESSGSAARCIFEYAEGATDFVLLSGVSGDVKVRLLSGLELNRLNPFDPTCPISELVDAGSSTLALSLTPEESEILRGVTSLWIAAELLGIAERAGELSVAYARDRQQFGLPIGSYQSVKHRVVDDYVALQSAKALVEDAANAWDKTSQDRFIKVHAARAIATKTAFSTTAQCIQVHGAAGFSWEHVAHLYYKRARRLAAALGSLDASRRRVAELLFPN